MTELALDGGSESENLRLYFSDPVINVCFVYSRDRDAAVLIVVLSSGIRTAILPQEANSSTWILSTLHSPSIHNSMRTKITGLQIREGVSLSCSDFSLITEGIDLAVSVIVGTSAGTMYRAKIFDEGRIVVSNEYSVSNWMGGFFRSPAKTSATLERLCCVLHSNQLDTWYSLSEDGRLRKWQGGKSVMERLIKVEKSLGGVRHAFLAFSMAAMSAESQECLIFALRAEHSSATLMAWCYCRDFSVLEVDGDLINIVAEKLKEQGDSVNVLKIQGFKTVSLSGQSEGAVQDIITIWQGYSAQVITLSRFIAATWRHNVIHTISLEISTEVEVSKLHIEGLNNMGGLNDERKQRLMDEAVAFVENRVFRPRWFQRRLIVMAVNDMLLSKGMPSEVPPDLSSLLEVKRFVREIMDGLAKKSVNPGEADFYTTAFIWWDLFRRCFLKWRISVDDYAGVGVVGSMVWLLKSSAISYFREQQREEMIFFGATPASDLLMRVVYNSLVWAQEADPGGLRFCANMSVKDPKAALVDLLNASLIHIEKLPGECDPDLFLRSPSRVIEVQNCLQRFFTSSQQFLEQIIGIREARRTLQTGAKEYADSQQMYVHLEVLRGIGLFLSMLIHFDTSITASISETLGADLDTCAKLLSFYHVLRWSATRVDPTVNPSLWNAERSFISIAAIVSPNLDQRMEGINLANAGNIHPPQRFGVNIVHNLIVWIFGHLCSRDEAVVRPDLTEVWKDLSFLIDMLRVHESSRSDKLNPSVEVLMRGICYVRTSDFKAAKLCLNSFVDMARTNIQVLRGLVNNVLNQDTSGAQTDYYEDIVSCFEITEEEDVLPLIDLFFLLHDERNGIFRIISDTIDRTNTSARGVDIELSKNELRFIELSSLRKFSALATRMRANSRYRLSLDVLGKLTALVHDRVIVNIVSHYGRVNPMSEVAFDIAYSLIADKIKDCRDADMAKLRKQGEDDDLRIDGVERICAWCKAMQTTVDPEQEMNTVLSFLIKRRKHTSYQLLRCFLAQLQSRRVLHRVCAYPWIGCGQTVDSFLKALCDVPGRDQIDAAYRAR